MRLLDLAAAATGKELTSGEVRLWLQLQEAEQPAALEAAFKAFFDGQLVDQWGNVSGNFFPKPAQIRQLLDQQKRSQVAARQDQEQQKLLADMRAARQQAEAEGQPVGLAQIRALLKQCCDRVKRMP